MSIDSKDSYEIPLPPFVLLRRLGKGGMGEVWLGRHVSQGRDVAVKVITRSRARNARYLWTFRNEVRAAARLDHPSITKLYEYGVLPAITAQASGGSLVKGSPYLAMEYAGQGSLKNLSKPMDWPSLKQILLSLLDALAHSHARGVVHRDLKPDNILLASEGGSRLSLKLSDFGIAHPMWSEHPTWSILSTIGTPNYMAPEQFLGAWRDYGPWTDLYALGCLAFELASGQVPFALGPHLQRIGEAHLYLIPPRLKSPHSMPAGFEGWILRLLQKEPDRRFSCAAEAAQALLLLEDRELVDCERPSISRGGDTQRSFAKPARRRTAREQQILRLTDQPITLTLPPFVWLTSSEGDRERVALDDVPSLCPIPAPILSSVWQRPEGGAKSANLIDAGLGLQGFRTIPMVGRQLERNLLWQVLGQVHQEQQASLILIKGTAGVGKSRLVTWLQERAHEFAGIRTMSAVHSPMGGADDGIARMVARFFKIAGLSRDELSVRCERLMRELGVINMEYKALGDLLSQPQAGSWDFPVESHSTSSCPNQDLFPSAGSLDSPQERLGNQEQRFALIYHLLSALSRCRPLIVWLDDVQWGIQAIEFARFVLDQQSRQPRPLLLVLTLESGSLTPCEFLAQRIDELVALPQCAEINLEELDPENNSYLIREELRLGGDLAKELERRSHGIPLFSIRVVEELLKRRELVSDGQQFTTRGGAQVTIPDDLHRLWLQGVDNWLAELAGNSLIEPAKAKQALQIAAAQGMVIDRSEWDTACELAGVSTSAELVDSLLASRLAEPRPGGWCFVHGLLRESLERQAREEGAWAAHNRICATALCRCYPTINPELTKRVAFHRFEAERVEESGLFTKVGNPMHSACDRSEAEQVTLS